MKANYKSLSLLTLKQMYNYMHVHIHSPFLHLYVGIYILPA